MDRPDRTSADHHGHRRRNPGRFSLTPRPSARAPLSCDHGAPLGRPGSSCSSGAESTTPPILGLDGRESFQHPAEALISCVMRGPDSPLRPRGPRADRSTGSHPQGLLVVETKTYRGIVLGRANESTRTRVIGRERHSFQNPLARATPKCGRWWSWFPASRTSVEFCSPATPVLRKGCPRVSTMPPHWPRRSRRFATGRCPPNCAWPGTECSPLPVPTAPPTRGIGVVWKPGVGVCGASGSQWRCWPGRSSGRPLE
jgi:hypothetical protein